MRVRTKFVSVAREKRAISAMHARNIARSQVMQNGCVKFIRVRDYALRAKAKRMHEIRAAPDFECSLVSRTC